MKFQTYKADLLAIKESPAYWDTSKEPALNQHELFSRFDRFGPTEYAELARYAEQRSIEFMSTAFDLESLEAIDPLVNIHKVASADLTNIPSSYALSLGRANPCSSPPEHPASLKSSPHWKNFGRMVHLK